MCVCVCVCVRAGPVEASVQAKCSPCMSSPCQNQGICEVHHTQKYICTCTSGFTVCSYWQKVHPLLVPKVLLIRIWKNEKMNNNTWHITLCHYFIKQKLRHVTGAAHFVTACRTTFSSNNLKHLYSLWCYHSLTSFWKNFGEFYDFIKKKIIVVLNSETKNFRIEPKRNFFFTWLRVL